MSLIFVDCEASAPCPGFPDMGLMEFGAVEFETRETFYGDLRGKGEGEITGIFEEFESWLKKFSGQPVFVSDNPAFDWQFVNYEFHHRLGRNPFGHSARRISDFYAGLRGDWRKTQEWKRLRITPHTHNPVHDSQGNCEAFERILKGER